MHISVIRQRLEPWRYSLEKILFHIDVNNAFLAWEAVYRLKEDPDSIDLREIPSAIGGRQDDLRGVITAKSIPCKKYGVITGESVADAKRKCPVLKLFPGNHKVYREYSNAFFEILKEYTPDVKKYSIDEAFMDITGTEKLWGEPLVAANNLRERIYNELGFTVNIGISSNKLLAKMASDFEKPNRVHTLFPDEVPAKMWPLPVSDLFGIGKSATAKLKTYGIETIGDLANTDFEALTNIWGKYGIDMWRSANGFSSDELQLVSPPAKSYGNSTTVSKNISDVDTASNVLLSLAESVGTRLRKDNVKIEVIATTIRYSNFAQESHQKTLNDATNITKEIHQVALDLFKATWDYKTPIRHLGISTSRVKAGDDFKQVSLFDMVANSNSQKLEKADTMVDDIRKKYGSKAIKRGTL